MNDAERKEQCHEPVSQNSRELEAAPSQHPGGRQPAKGWAEVLGGVGAMVAISLASAYALGWWFGVLARVAVAGWRFWW